MASVTVYTDGACIDQGTKNARAGYGVFWGDGNKNNCFGRVTGPQDSNRAELRAAHQAIKTAVRNGYEKIKIRTDSSYVVETIRNAQNYHK
ncbi:hypothetical protein CAEBREN_05833 [Caenorhabditis brenneri]|uniref:ribonuclease H n=1 Tax=Caenorhabditis brenneri TaxID=135651 RepID=G0NW95_CAEBE|nr:hypothetical protein CAEBREN_05833 [Caenorhabditis brenneri]